MQVKLAVVADYANVSAEGKLNILGIFDRINVSDLPAAHPQMHLILRLEAHPAERDRPHKVEIRLHDPDGQTIFELAGEIVPRGDSGQVIVSNQILTINNMAIGKVGEYTFVVFVDNDLKAEVPLAVVLAQPEPAEQQGEQTELGE
jgi:hypothetical protein